MHSQRPLAGLTPAQMDGQSKQRKAKQATGGNWFDQSGEIIYLSVDADNPIVTVSPTSVTVNESSTATYTMVLGKVPTANVTVATARKTGSGQDTDLTVSAGASLTFTTSDWNTAQGRVVDIECSTRQR